MKKNYFKTDVMFRKEKDGTILAVFPYEIEGIKGECSCYAHVGQHMQMDWGYLSETKPVKDKSEYHNLCVELESIGYDLNVIQRRNYDKYLKAYRAINKI